MSKPQRAPEDSFEKQLEQGDSSSDSKAKMMAQVAQSQPSGSQKKSSSTGGGLSALTSFADPDAWVKDLYGLPQTYSKDLASSAIEKGKSEKNNHTPLDTKKLEGKYNEGEITPRHRQFFKKYQQEYAQFVQQKKKQEENAKRQQEEEEKKRKEEQRRQAQQDQGEAGSGQGKQKQRLGQPRRKATTELHPETKAGGAK